MSALEPDQTQQYREILELRDKEKDGKHERTAFNPMQLLQDRADAGNNSCLEDTHSAGMKEFFQKITVPRLKMPLPDFEDTEEYKQFWNDQRDLMLAKPEYQYMKLAAKEAAVNAKIERYKKEIKSSYKTFIETQAIAQESIKVLDELIPSCTEHLVATEKFAQLKAPSIEGQMVFVDPLNSLKNASHWAIRTLLTGELGGPRGATGQKAENSLIQLREALLKNPGPEQLAKLLKDGKKLFKDALDKRSWVDKTLFKGVWDKVGEASKKINALSEGANTLTTSLGEKLSNVASALGTSQNTGGAGASVAPAGTPHFTAAQNMVGKLTDKVGSAAKEAINTIGSTVSNFFRRKP
jgi:hypothetical protein